MSLTQTEADYLLRLDKRFIDSAPIELSQVMGMDFIRELLSLDRKEKFLLDVRRGRRQKAYLRYQTRARQCIILARLDIDGPRHKNPSSETDPEGRWLSGTHLHIYREGYEARIAFELDAVSGFTFTRPLELTKTFCEFLDFCHVVDRPPVQLVI